MPSIVRKTNVIEVCLGLLRPYRNNGTVRGFIFYFICFSLIPTTIDILVEVK